MDNTIIEKLLAKKKQVERAKTERAELQGEQIALVRRLKTEFKCTSVARAIEKREFLLKQIQQKEDEIRDKIDSLEASYDW